MKRTVVFAVVLVSFFVLAASQKISEGGNTKSNSALYIHFADDEYHNSQIADTSIADLISHLIGSTPLSATTDRSAFPKTNIFNKPKANLLVVFDGEDSEFSITGKRIEINPSVASDSIAAITNIATGATPYAHGIIGKFWKSLKGETEFAYSGRAQPHLVGLADIVSQTSNGRSLTVSASADGQMARALAAHSTTFQQKPYWNNHLFYCNTRSMSIASQNEQILSKEEVLAKIATLEGVEVNGDEVSVGNFVFNLAEDADLMFFTELVLIKNVEAFVQQPYYRSLTADENLDSFAIAISTLRALKTKYSASQYGAAVSLVQSLIASLEKTLSATYNNNFVAEIVFLGSPSSSVTIKIEEVTNHIKEVESLEFVMDSAESEAFDATPNTSDGYKGVHLSTDALAQFQIIGFILIVLTIALVFIVLAVCNISTEKDTIFVAPAKKHF